MFGYITVDKPELKIKDFETYKSYYCGLCRQLKKQNGNVLRISLSYDMAFIYILLTGLYEPETKTHIKRCVVHGFGKVNVSSNDIAEYVADMSAVMTYYKMADDWNDERKISAGILKNILSRKNKGICERYSDKIKLFEENMTKLREGEKNKNYNLDEMSGYFGNMMGEILVYKNDIWEKHLRKMGKYLGKFIYLMDAYDDIKEDEKNNRYNPLTELKDSPEFEAKAEDILMMLMAKCAEEFEILPIILHEDLIRNVLYSGVWTKFNKKNNSESVL